MAQNKKLKLNCKYKMGYILPCKMHFGKPYACIVQPRRRMNLTIGVKKTLDKSVLNGYNEYRKSHPMTVML